MESTISAAPQISIDREKTLRSHRRYWVLRRAQDIVFSLLALILLAPLEALANQQTLSTGDQIALNKWGKNVFSPASVTSNRTYWGENGKITKK